MEHHRHPRGPASLITHSAWVQRRVFVSGRVQGVGFRRYTVKFASRFKHLKGWVRNLEDGRVEAVFCGDADEVLAMVEWCRNGPPSAQVTHLEVQEEEVDPGLSWFEVSE